MSMVKEISISLFHSVRVCMPGAPLRDGGALSRFLSAQRTNSKSYTVHVQGKNLEELHRFHLCI